MSILDYICNPTEEIDLSNVQVAKVLPDDPDEAVQEILKTIGVRFNKQISAGKHYFEQIGVECAGYRIEVLGLSFGQIHMNLIPLDEQRKSMGSVYSMSYPLEGMYNIKLTSDRLWRAYIIRNDIKLCFPVKKFLKKGETREYLK